MEPRLLASSIEGVPSWLAVAAVLVSMAAGFLQACFITLPLIPKWRTFIGNIVQEITGTKELRVAMVANHEESMAAAKITAEELAEYRAKHDGEHDAVTETLTKIAGLADTTATRLDAYINDHNADADRRDAILIDLEQAVRQTATRVAEITGAQPAKRRKPRKK